MTLSVSYDAAFHYGTYEDGSLQLPVKTKDGKVVEASFFTGRDKKKDIYVVSTQAGCPLRCQFCELGEEAFSRNLTKEEIIDQTYLLSKRVEKAELLVLDKPRKLTFANTGEPLLNPDLPVALWGIELQQLSAGWDRLPRFDSYKISTVLPRGKQAKNNLSDLAQVAGVIKTKPVQLQISLISLSEEERNTLTKGCGASFNDIVEAAELWRKYNPDRKVNLSILGCSYRLQDLNPFSPDLFRLRIRPYIPTVNGKLHDLRVRRANISGLKELGYEITRDGQPTPIEQRFGLAANVTRRRYLEMASQ